jgi:chromosome segregation ATPase
MKKKNKLTPIQELNARLSSTDGEIRREMENMGYELSGVKSEIVGLKSEIGGLKSEIFEVKSEIVGLESEITGIKKTMTTKDDLNMAINQVVDRITGHMDGLWGESKRLDNVALMQGQRITDQFERLNDHERRITALETKTA